MRGWIDIATLAKPKNLNGGLVARGASGLPFLLYPGLNIALVPPKVDAPRAVTVDEFQERGDDEVLVFFSEVEDLTAAEMLTGCHCLVREDEVDLSVLSLPDALPDWEGWTVHDRALGLVGEVVSIDDHAFQPLLVVKRAEAADALVPLVDDFVERIDEEAREIHLTVPAGLWELS